MRELFSAFGSEVFRPLMTLFAPGVVALAPWVVALMQRSSGFYSLVNENRTESSLLLTFTALVVGMLLEDFGSHLESKFLDRALNEETAGKHMVNWYDYLRIAYQIEPIGAKYIRSILLRMKFELGMASAALTVVAGVFATTLRILPAVELSSSALGLAALLFLEARRSHAALSKTRCLLLQGLIVLGAGAPREETS